MLAVDRDRRYPSVMGMVCVSPAGKVRMPAGIELPDDMPCVRNVAAGGKLIVLVPETGTCVLSYTHGAVSLDIWECGGSVAEVACGLQDFLVLYTTGWVWHVCTADGSMHLVDLPGAAVAVRAGEGVWAAILSDGSLYTWGSQRRCRQLGRSGDERVPGRVEGTFVDVHWSSLYFAAALTATGQLYVWGGRGSTYPVLATQGTFARLAVARCHFLAMRSDLTSVYTWGQYEQANFSAKSYTLTTEDRPVTNLVACPFTTELHAECLADAALCRAPRCLMDVDVGAERARLRMPLVLAEVMSRQVARRERSCRLMRTSTEQQRELWCEGGRLPPELWQEIIRFVH